MSVQFIEPPDRYYYDDHSDREENEPDIFDDADELYERDVLDGAEWD